MDLLTSLLIVVAMLTTDAARALPRYKWIPILVLTQSMMLIAGDLARSTH